MSNHIKWGVFFNNTSSRENLIDLVETGSCNWFTLHKEDQIELNKLKKLYKKTPNKALAGARAALRRGGYHIEVVSHRCVYCGHKTTIGKVT